MEEEKLKKERDAEREKEREKDDEKKKSEDADGAGTKRCVVLSSYCTRVLLRILILLCLFLCVSLRRCRLCLCDCLYLWRVHGGSATRASFL